MKRLNTVEEIHAAFWAKVDIRASDECWPWLAGTAAGYGVFAIHGKAIKAHRAAWIFTHGEIKDSLLVRHFKCGYKLCCNPAHLRPGTYKQNQDDTLRMGRVVCGEQHPCSVLTSVQVTWLRATYLRTPRSPQLLAKELGVSKNLVYDILKGSSWGHQDRRLIRKLRKLPRLKSGQAGECNGNSKLTTFLVYELRKRAANGESALSLAALFGIGKVMVVRIANGTAWKSVI